MLQNIKGVYLPCPQWFSFVLSRYCVAEFNLQMQQNSD